MGKRANFAQWRVVCVRACARVLCVYYKVADHGEEADVAADLETTHADLHHRAAAAGVEESHGLVRRRRHEGPLDTPAPGWRAVRHPELGRQLHLAKSTVHLAGREREEGMEEGKWSEWVWVCLSLCLRLSLCLCLCESVGGVGVGA